MTLLNARDGGINGVHLVWEECETVYDVDRGVECYERLKARGPTGAAVVHPRGTPIVYALTERATHDKIPLLTVGFGRADASDGRVFPYVFNPPINYWSQNTAKIRFIGQQVGGMEQLKGRKIAHVYHDSDYGRETMPILDTQAAQYGFAVQHLAVQPPGLDQKETWRRVKAAQPDWVILRSTGVMTPTALKEAAQVGVPRDKIVGHAGDLRGAGHGAGRGGGHRLHLRELAMARGQTSRSSRISSRTSMPGARGLGPKGMSARSVGTWACWSAVLATEALRTAMRQFGNQPLTGAQVQWGLDHLTLTAASLKEMGAEGLLPPLTLSCRDHEGGGGVKFQQWDGKQWTVLTDWIAPDQALVRPLVEASAAKYAQEKGITPRDCP